VAKERVVCVDGVRGAEFDEERRAAAEDAGKPRAGRCERVEADGTAARDIILAMAPSMERQRGMAVCNGAD
jgi:hypothetical protein